jgi:hypothetical protein
MVGVTVDIVPNCSYAVLNRKFASLVGDLSQASTVGQAPFDFPMSIHSQHPSRHRSLKL